VNAGDGVKSRSQVIERKIESLEDMATKVVPAAFYALLPFFRFFFPFRHA
jgi:hypothetical protein